MSDLTRYVRTISVEIKCIAEICCDCPCKFTKLLRDQHDANVSVNDLVPAGNIGDLLSHIHVI